MKRIAIICLLIICVSCEKDITDDFRNLADRKIAISGEIVALDTPMVHISRSISMVDIDSVFLLSDATVELQSGEDSYLMQHVGKGFFRADEMVIQPGQSYTLHCSSDSLPPASVVIDVPTVPVVTGLQYSVDTAFIMHIEITFSDAADSEDMYSYYLSGWRRRIRQNQRHDIDSFWIDTTNIYGRLRHFVQDPILEYSDGYRSLDEIDKDGDWGDLLYFSDKEIDGQSYDLSIDINFLNTYNDSIPEIELTFQHRDKHLQEFLLAYGKYDPYPDITIMQPVQLYSNINGGMGLVYALSNYHTVIDVSEWYNDPEFLERVNSPPQPPY